MKIIFITQNKQLFLFAAEYACIFLVTTTRSDFGVFMGEKKQGRCVSIYHIQWEFLGTISYIPFWTPIKKKDGKCCGGSKRNTRPTIKHSTMLSHSFASHSSHGIKQKGLKKKFGRVPDWWFDGSPFQDAEKIGGKNWGWWPQGGKRWLKILALIIDSSPQIQRPHLNRNVSKK